MQKRGICPNLEKNMKTCGCTYHSCDKKGRCCECIRFHQKRGEIPGCLFSREVEKTYERSIERFVTDYR